MPRLFLGLELPPAIRQLLFELHRPWIGSRWVAPENYHLTVRFIGELTPTQMNDLADQLATLVSQPFTMRLATTGHFSRHNHPHTLWVGALPLEPLMQLRHRLERVVTKLGLKAEKQRFHPHVTLARLQHVDAQALAQFLEATALFESPPFPVEQVHLYSSQRTQHGQVYTIEYSYPLVDSDDLTAVERWRRGLPRGSE